MKNLLFAFCLIPFLSFGQKELFRYGFSDTLIEKVTKPFFVSEKVIWFDSTYIKSNGDGNTYFKIGKVCEQFGCDGTFSETGKIQSGWWLIENKIIISYLTPISNQSFHCDLKVWRYNAKSGRFVLLI